MNATEVMRTTFSAREFTADPLLDEVVYRILDNARFAPSGGNRQGWRVIIVRRPETRRAIARLMEPPIKRYVAQVQAGELPWNTIRASAVDAQTIERTEPPARFTNTIALAPVVLIVCVDLSVVASMDRDLDRVGVTSGASIYPFAWNILLAARNEGFGGVLTTFITASEREAKDLLGIPEQFAVAAAIPLGRPVKRLTRLQRKPVEEFAMHEHWEGAALVSPAN